MDDIQEKLSALLSDPDGMEKIKAMAQSLIGSQSEPELSASKPEPISDPGFDIAAVTRMMSLLKNHGDDSRVRLLLALKPHLSEEKQNRVDSAVKMMKLLELAPLLKEAGIFSL
jgi:hypothetical protein